MTIHRYNSNTAHTIELFSGETRHKSRKKERNVESIIQKLSSWLEIWNWSKGIRLCRRKRMTRKKQKRLKKRSLEKNKGLQRAMNRQEYVGRDVLRFRELGAWDFMPNICNSRALGSAIYLPPLSVSLFSFQITFFLFFFSFFIIYSLPSLSRQDK